VAHHDLMGDIEMNFTDTVNPNVNVVFLCLGHGKSIQFLEQNQFASHTKIIDLGNDFRLTKDKKFKANLLFTVCLNSIKPIEMPNTLQIRDVCHCDTIGFITACSKRIIKTDVHINATTEVLAQESAHQKRHFSWRSNVALQSIRPPAFRRN
jgi:N-acetyl-gamma-glutamyl-phosphate reductase